MSFVAMINEETMPIDRPTSLTSLIDDEDDGRRTLASDSLKTPEKRLSTPENNELPSFYLRRGNRSPEDLTERKGFQPNSTEVPDGLFFDPNPERIHRPQLITPILYKQNITIKFLKPPEIPQAPLIIREVRPPQAPPPPPLVIRQFPVPPLSPSPVVLREKPPPIPSISTIPQVVTKTLSPIPPPPRSVIVEKLPSLPTRPPDVVIERWIPYQSLTGRRQVIVEKADDPPSYPPPKNFIVTYDEVTAQIVREVQRLPIMPEDPENYSARYGNSLLDPEQLLAQAKELGITEDLSPPALYEEHSMSRANSFAESYSPNRSIGNSFSPTYEHFVQNSSPQSHSVDFDRQFPIDLARELAQYDLSAESIPF